MLEIWLVTYHGPFAAILFASNYGTIKPYSNEWTYAQPKYRQHIHIIQNSS